MAAGMRWISFRLIHAALPTVFQVLFGDFDQLCLGHCNAPRFRLFLQANIANGPRGRHARKLQQRQVPHGAAIRTGDQFGIGFERSGTLCAAGARLAARPDRHGHSSARGARPGWRHPPAHRCCARECRCGSDRHLPPGRCCHRRLPRVRHDQSTARRCRRRKRPSVSSAHSLPSPLDLR